MVAQQSSCSTLAFQPVGGRAFPYTAPDSASIMVGMSENLSSESRYASGVALVNVVAAGNEAGTVLDAWFPAPALTQTPDLSLADELDALVADHPERNARTEVRTASINLDEAPEDAVDAYLRLHLL